MILKGLILPLMCGVLCINTPFLDFYLLVSTRMQVYVVNGVVVERQVVLCMISPKVFGSGHPIDFVLFLTSSILHPIKSYIHGFGTLLYHASIYNAVWCLIIGFQWRCWLWVAQLIESISNNNTFLCINGQCWYFIFGFWWYNMAYDGRLVLILRY